MAIQTGRIQRFLYGYIKQLKVEGQIQKRSTLEVSFEDKVALSIKAKRINVRETMASNIYRKITAAVPLE